MAWVALIAAVVSLIVAVVTRLLGGQVLWTSWGLSFVIIANSVVFLLPQARQQHPRLTTAFYRLGTVASVVILIAIFVQVWHRYTAS